MTSPVNADHRHLLWATVARFIAVSLFFEALLPLFPYLSAGFGLTEKRFQLLLGAGYFSFALAQLASVAFIARVGLFPCVAFSSLGLGVLALIIFCSRSPGMFAICFVAMYVVNGIGSNATRVALREIGSDLQFRRLMAWSSGVAEMIQIVMPLVAGIVVALWDWRWAMLLLVMPVAMSGLWIVRAGGIGRRFSVAFPARIALRKLSRMPAFVTPVLTAATFQLAFGPVSANLPFMLSDEAGQGAVASGAILSTSSGCIAIGLLVSGWLASRWSSTRLMATGFLLMMGGMASMLAASLLGIAMAIAGSILVQAALGFIVVPCCADAMNASVKDRTAISALFWLVQAGCGGLAVMMAAMAKLGSVQTVTLATAVSLALAFFVSRVACRNRVCAD